MTDVFLASHFKQSTINGEAVSGTNTAEFASLEEAEAYLRSQPGPESLDWILNCSVMHDGKSVSQFWKFKPNGRGAFLPTRHLR